MHPHSQLPTEPPAGTCPGRGEGPQRLSPTVPSPLCLAGGHKPAPPAMPKAPDNRGRCGGNTGCKQDTKGANGGHPNGPASPRCRFRGNAASPPPHPCQKSRKKENSGARGSRRTKPHRGLPGAPDGTVPPSPAHGQGDKAVTNPLQTSAALRDSRHVYLQRENKEPIIYTKQTTMSVNKEAAGEGKAIYSNSANFSSSTIKKALIIFRNNRQLTNRFSRCK